MLSDFSALFPHTKNENWPLSERAKMRWASTLSAVFENGRSPTITGERRFGPPRVHYRRDKKTLSRRDKKTLSTTTNKRTDPPFPRRDENETTRKHHAEIFAKTAGTHGLSFSPAERKRALRVSRERWRRGIAYLGEAAALGVTPTLAITLNWQSLAEFSDAELVHDRVDLITARFVRRLSEWYRRRGLRRSFIWSAAMGTDKGAHCHIAAHIPAGHEQAFLSWLAKTTGVPLDPTRTNQSEAYGEFGGWYASHVQPAFVADAVCYVCIQALKHLPSAFDPKKCFGVSLSKK